MITITTWCMYEAQCWAYVMSIRHVINLKSKCHISHIFWTNYIFGKIKTLCYINFKNWYNNCTIIFQEKLSVQEIWEKWHFDFMSCVWQITLQSASSCGQCESQCESKWRSSNADISVIRSINWCFHIYSLI